LKIRIPSEGYDLAIKAAD